MKLIGLMHSFRQACFHAAHLDPCHLQCFEKTFFQIKKIGNWQIPTDTIIAMIEAQRQIFNGGLRNLSFLLKAQNICTNKQLRINIIYLFFNFGMSQIFLVI